jgi:hypothetical protein
MTIGDVQIDTESLLPEFGPPNGMIRIGYGYSVLGDRSPTEAFDIASYIEMFSDWGQGEGHRMPGWMTKPDRLNP